MPEAESGKEKTESQNRQEANTRHFCKTADLGRIRCQAFIFPRIYSRHYGICFELHRRPGGMDRTVNTGVQGLNAALRLEPRKSSKQIGSIPNGERVETVTDALIYDPEARRNFVMVSWNGKVGYVASSIVGLPR